MGEEISVVEAPPVAVEEISPEAPAAVEAVPSEPEGEDALPAFQPPDAGT
jgi:hypothetical protein